MPGRDICANNAWDRNSALATTRVPSKVIGADTPALGVTTPWLGTPRSAKRISFSVDSTSIVSGEMVAQ